MKRFFAVFLTVALLLACAPITFAEEPQNTPESVGAIGKSPADPLRTDETAAAPAIEDVPTVDAPSLPLEASEAGAAGVNDMSAAYQSRGGTEPQRDKVPPQAADEGESAPADAEPIETAPTEVVADLQATYSGTCGNNLSWNLDTDTGVLTISGTGAMTDYDWGGAPWYSYHSSIQTVTIGSGVTSIGDRAFYNCSNLTSVAIGNSVTSIGDYAFYYCRSLTSVNIGNSVTSIGSEAFRDCGSLTSVTIPDSVTSIGYAAFRDCGSLTSVSIPDSVTSIGYAAFRYCSGLTSIEVSENNPSYASRDGVLFNKDKTTLIQCPGGKSGAYTIPDSVTSIGDSAFNDCNSLTSVTIPDGVTSIGGHAFYNCSSLTSVTVPDSVTSIQGYTFSGCSSLTSITIPDSVTSIGDSAFSDCNSLTSVTIPDSVTSIGWGAFFDCSSLTSVIYCGTAAQWNKISIGTNNDPLKNASRQYHASHSWTLETATTQATCTEAGFGDYVCSACGIRKSDSIPALGHDYVQLNGLEPTCTEAGWALLGCSRCSDMKYEDYDPLGHDLVHHDAQAPTCEAIGWEAYDTCTRCEYTTRGEDVPATGHDYIPAVTAAATCTEDGVLTYVCKNDTSHRYTEAIPALGHDMEVKQRVEPTKEADGFEIAVCSRCKLTMNTVLPKITYTPGDINNDGTINAKDTTILRRYLAGGYGVTLADEAVADVNKDGTVNAKDVTFLRRALAGGYGIVLA